MRKLKKISLEKKVIAKFAKDEMSEILGGGYYTSSGIYLPSSAATAFTAKSCNSDGTCYGSNCK